MDINQFFKAYAWETLDSSQEFKGDFVCTDTHAPTEIESNICKLHIGRDENYNLEIKAEGSLSNSGIRLTKEQKIMSGTRISRGTIICNTAYEGVVTLHHCISIGYTMRHNLQDGKADFEASFSAHEINWKRRSWKETGEADAVIEWYLNGVKDSTLFCDQSSIIDEVSRVITSAGDVIYDLNDRRENYSCDCLYIALEDTGVLIRKVLPQYGPVWSNNIALEYRSTYGRIPDKTEREKISEILSFLLGRHLILVGDTTYYGNTVIESNMYCPHSHNTVAECNSNTREIVPVHHYHDECNNFRRFAQKLIPAYLKVRETYAMDSVLARYWLANIMPVGVNLPILAGAMEVMMKAWFKGKKSRTKGVYLDAKKYESAIGCFIEQVQSVLDDCEYKEKILNKISGAYQMGVNDRYFIFLDEIGLEYGTAEEDSIRARNAFTHGDSGMDDLDTLQKTKTMFILIGRIFLKLLEYDEEYIDESVLGFPRKRIDDMVG